MERVKPSRSTFEVRRSFLKSSEQEFDLARQDLARREICLTKGFYNPPISGDTFLQAAQTPIKEVGILLDRYPFIPEMIPTFPSLYRLLRTYEIMGEIQRGGKSLLVGSGATIPEFLALYLKPPASEATSAQTSFKAELLSGQAWAVEPSIEYLMQGLTGFRHFSQDDYPINLFLCSLGKFIQGGGVDQDINMMLWHRVDPYIVTGEPKIRFPWLSRRGERQKIKALVKTLIEMLSAGGFMALSVGVGNNEREFLDRINFLREVYDLLEDTGDMKVKPGPQVFLDEQSALLFGGSRFGMLGAVVATKTT